MCLQFIGWCCRGGIAAFLIMLSFFPAMALELSAGISLPPGGIINSLYLSGTPISGLTLKVKAENDVEYTAFF